MKHSVSLLQFRGFCNACLEVEFSWTCLFPIENFKVCAAFLNPCFPEQAHERNDFARALLYLFRTDAVRKCSLPILQMRLGIINTAKISPGHHLTVPQPSADLGRGAYSAHRGAGVGFSGKQS